MDICIISSDSDDNSVEDTSTETKFTSSKDVPNYKENDLEADKLVLKYLTEKYRSEDKKTIDDFIEIQNVPLPNKKKKKASPGSIAQDNRCKTLEAKRAAFEYNKNSKPHEIIKRVCVTIDNEIIDSPIGSEILENISKEDVSYKIDAQIIPSTVTWTTKVKSLSNEDENNPLLCDENQDSDQLVYVMSFETLLETINNSKLTSKINQIREILPEKKITLAIHGLNAYFKAQNRLKRDSLRLENGDKTSKLNKKYQNWQLSKLDVETVLTDLQIIHKCSSRLIECPNDLAKLILQYSKSISQIPYKQQKNLKYEQFRWYVEGSNKNCVKIDKEGNGLAKLWKQDLTMFHLASLATANAITSIYPTVSDLMDSYAACVTQDEGETLLQNIPLHSVGRQTIGKQMSRKIYLYFTSRNSEVCFK